MRESDSATAQAPLPPPTACLTAGRHGANAPNHGVLTLRRDPDGHLQLEARDTALMGGAADGDLRPIEHLGVALAGCLSEFAGRFLERRQLPALVRMQVHWKVSVQHCAIETIRVTLHIDTALDEMSRQTLYRMLEQCPIHKALEGNVDMAVDVVEARQE
jgi:uncharacterized OsmC-like protein